jgi:hypothetical protein
MQESENGNKKAKQTSLYKMFNIGTFWYNTILFIIKSGYKHGNNMTIYPKC